MNVFSPLHLIRAHEWSHSFFTTYSLSLAFFEGVIVDALIRQNVEETVVLADVAGVRAALAEYGSRCAGRAYEIEPILVDRGCFHPKLMALTSKTEGHLVVGSNNLTFGGWGTNLECVEHLHPAAAADAFEDAAEFLESLVTAPWVKHRVERRCMTLAEELRRLAVGHPKTGDIRLLHSVDRSILDQLADLAMDLGGAERLSVAAPFHDGKAMDEVCARLGLDRVFVHTHPHGTVAGSFGSHWPATSKTEVTAVAVSFFEADKRPLHAKAFEIVCRKGRLVISGSANATMAALGTAANVELSVARVQREAAVTWVLSLGIPPAAAVPPPKDEKAGPEPGVLRAVLEGEILRGWVLTAFPPGPATLSHLTASAETPVGDVVIDVERQFVLRAPDVERNAWTADRLILKVASPTGAVATGFVSFADFREVTRRVGNMASRLFAVLSGTETPADVAAVMSWFHDHADYLLQSSGSSEGKSHPHGSGDVAVANLLIAAPVPVPEDGVAGSATSASWRRFMELVLASFREARGPIPPEVDVEEPSNKGEDPAPKKAKPTPNPSTADRPFRVFERLLALMVKGPLANRRRAFWMAHYVCDRLEPDSMRVRTYLQKVLDALIDQPISGRDKEAITAAHLVLAADLRHGQEATALARIARRRLLRAGVDLQAPMPDVDLVRGFARTLAPECDFAALWTTILAVRTAQEEVKAFRLAGGDAELRAEFPYLGSLTELIDMTASDRKKITFMSQFSNSCPRCHIALPIAQASRLRERGAARHERCGCVLLCEEI